MERNFVRYADQIALIANMFPRVWKKWQSIIMLNDNENHKFATSYQIEPGLYGPQCTDGAIEAPVEPVYLTSLIFYLC